MSKKQRQEHDAAKQKEIRQTTTFSNHADSQNQNHNSKKEGLGPNTKR